jgi:hypothetical protein
MNTRQRRHQISMGRAALNRPALVPDPLSGPRTGLLGPVVVLRTLAVGGPPGTGISHYEIHVAPDTRADAPRYELLTRSVDLFEQAVDLENAQTVVSCAWHISKRPNGVYCQVLDAFEEVR